ncbi:hypothetical protein SAMN05444156_0611 [Verrucomicrobium sp. GAS474]|uniref:hypothetical protein n=1 Tax=Verrucomicrobium sp. GAS474 TaxID=1882831 RepID=UPI00087C041D|nr:hypothetical protein [Verrucomicrobium sp. GAS474]SDT90552.1 hypothetical protein SAMN05444156_0611 [Verrucomicrobium sp. GAS474]
MFPNRKQYRRWTLPARQGCLSLLLALIGFPAVVIGYFQMFGNDQISKKILAGLEAQVRPDIDLHGLETKDLINTGPTLMGVFVNNRDAFADDFHWAVIAGDGKTKVPFDLPPFKGVKYSFRPGKTLELPLCLLSEFTKFLPPAYSATTLRAVYTQEEMCDTTIRHASGTSVPVVVTYSYKSPMGEQLNGMHLLYFCVSD